MTRIEESVRTIGYQADLFEKEAFRIIGFSAIHKPDTPDFELWERLKNDGRLKRLMTASTTVQLFGCSSFDPQATIGHPEGSYRHTVCIEETPELDSSILDADELFSLDIPASKWISFNLTKERFYNGKDYLFWGDDPYAMIVRLGFRFNWTVALHMDVFRQTGLRRFLCQRS